jgi:hypothetical protein
MNTTVVLNLKRFAVAGSLLLISAFGSQSVSAQTPGAFVAIPPEDQPLQGPGQSALNRDEDSLWSRPPKPSLTGSTGWSFILLTDLDGDGRADLCGLYGLNNGQHVYGCVRNSVNRTFYGVIVQAQAFNGRPDPSIHSTISVVDLNGDGSKHLCGRTMEGMKCQRFNVSTFDPPVALFPNNPGVDFSDANFWSAEPYYSTIAFARLGGKLALCGRGFDGVMCFLRYWGNFDPRPFMQTSFSDANGWDQPQYYRTLRYVDVDGDGDSDICARGRAGILCSVWRRTPNSHFEPSRVWTEQFRDIDGWSDPRYYTSIRFGDVNGDGFADVCGRGSQGLYCGINTSRPSLPGSSFAGLSSPVQQQMTDATRWGIPASNLRSFFIIDFDGDGKGDVCGLNAPTGGFPDLFCAKSRSTTAGAAFDSLVTRTKNVNGAADELVAGRLYIGGKLGFCWNTFDGSANCSAEWR